MSSLNRVILLGNLGRDPETRYTQGGDAVTNFSLATTERWKDKSGEKQEKTEWHRCVAFARTAEIAGEYLVKGSSCLIEGRLQTRKYNDKDGVEKYSTEIVVDKLVLISKGGGSESGGEAPARGQAAGKSSGGGPKKNVDDFDDDIPFVHNDLHGVDERARFERRIGRAR